MGYGSSGDLDLSGVGRLPLRVARGSSETAVSMLNRQAIRSGFRDMDELIRRVPNVPRRGRYSMPNLVAIGARINGCDGDALAASSIPRVGASFELGGETVLSGRNGIQGRVCVGCLREDVAMASPSSTEWAPFLRDHWQVAQIASCPRHRMSLIGVCPDCGEPLDMRRPRAGRCRCGADLLAVDVELLPETDVVADAYLLGRIRRGPGMPVPLLDGLSFGSAAGLALNVGVSLDPSVPFNRTWNPGFERSRHASRGLLALASGWEGFDDALSEIRAISSSDRRTYKLVGRYGRLQHWLGFEPVDELEPFRARMVEHVRRHGAIAESTTMFGAKLEGAEWTTMNAARVVVGRHPGPIYRMLVAMGLADQATGGERHDLITTAALQKVKEAFEGAVSSSEAQAILGCTANQFERYVELRLLEKVCAGGLTTSAYYRRDEVERFASKVMGDHPLVSQAPEGTITLVQANPLVKAAGELVTRAILDDRIRPVAILRRDDGVRSLPNVLVARTDVVELRRELVGDYTIAEASSVLCIPKLTLGRIWKLMARRKSGRRIRIDDIRDIRSRFVTLSEILVAHPHLGRYHEALDHLRGRGLTPVSEARWIVPVFERDLVSATLGAVPEPPLLFDARVLNMQVAKEDGG